MSDLTMAQTQTRYYNYMQRVIKIALEYPTVESENVAESAIRRYVASLDSDYKTMWEETEWLLLRANNTIEETEDKLRQATRRLSEEEERSRNVQRDIGLIERFHGVGSRTSQ